jgi:hypothetical protein
MWPMAPGKTPTSPCLPTSWRTRYERCGAKIKRLQDAGKTVVAQREEWRTRALAGEDKAAELATQLSHQPRDDRFDRLRRIVARELHPDFCTGGSVEKALRAEFFKALWPEIERLSEQGK